MRQVRQRRRDRPPQADSHGFIAETAELIAPPLLT